MTPSSFENVLVIGGTGMLREAVLQLARHSRSVTVVARGAKRLSELALRESNIRTIPIDYSNTTGFENALIKSTYGQSNFDLAVVWVHDSSPSAAMQAARFVGSAKRPGKFFHVLSSAVADPSSPSRSRRVDFDRIEHLDYHEVILGFVAGSSGSQSRWLTHQEISNGVIEAIETNASRFVVGTVRPWSERP
jgi:NADPH:quinone reductase-like Zn-dependent oxidoreductase